MVCVGPAVPLLWGGPASLGAFRAGTLPQESPFSLAQEHQEEARTGGSVFRCPCPLLLSSQPCWALCLSEEEVGVWGAVPAPESSEQNLPWQRGDLGTVQAVSFPCPGSLQCTEGLCHVCTFTCRSPNPQCDGIRRCGLRRCLGHEGRALWCGGGGDSVPL